MFVPLIENLFMQLALCLYSVETNKTPTVVLLLIIDSETIITFEITSAVNSGILELKQLNKRKINEEIVI